MPADHDLQQSLFAEEELAPKRYVPNPQHVRNSLKSLLEEMRAAKRWPWEGAVLELYRDIVPPQLYAELPDAEEATRWRSEIEAEAARLDAAAE
jgi:hypothetical protein